MTRYPAILVEDNRAEDAKPLRDARLMYAACVDADCADKIGLGPLTDYLTRTGGWPLALNEWHESAFDWAEAIAQARATYGFDYLIAVGNDRDANDTTRQAIYISQGSLSLGADLVASAETSSAYRAYMMDSALALRDWLGIGGAADDRHRLAEQVDAVLAFEARLANITRPESRNMSAAYNPMSVAQLQRWTDSVNNTRIKINWYAFLNRIYSAAEIAISEAEVLVVDDKHYLKDVLVLLESTPPRVLANYIHWRLVDHLAGDTTRRMSDVQFEFERAHLGLLEPEPRSSRCAAMVNFALGFALGARYVEKVFDDASSTAQIEEMIGHLRRAFTRLLDESAWMDSATKARAIRKADAIIHMVAYPAWLKNNTRLEQFYSGVNVTPTAHFLNMQNVKRNAVIRDLKLFKSNQNETEWDTLPTVANAFYNPLKNSIVFPAGILQLPFFDPNRPAAMNYGALGSMIGHEITHAFDDTGRQFDEHGNVADWWTDATSKDYVNRAECFVDQYSNYTVLNGSLVNGIATQGENMADNVGVKMALRAFEWHQQRATPSGDGLPALDELAASESRRLLFSSFASTFCDSQTRQALEQQLASDAHSPMRWRVNGALANSADFAEAFQCPPASPMNRPQKCALW